MVCDRLSPLLNDDERQWLRKSTARIEEQSNENQ
jgi:hypothetical protein